MTAITVTNAGSGYTAAPAVTISGGGGTGAAAKAAITSTVTGLNSSSPPAAATSSAPTVVFGTGGGPATINGIQMVGSGAVAITQASSIAVGNVTEALRLHPGGFTLTTAAGGGGGIALGFVDTLSGAVALTADGAITNALGAGVINDRHLRPADRQRQHRRSAPRRSPLATEVGSLQGSDGTSGGIFVANAIGLNIAGTGLQTGGSNAPIIVTSANSSLTVNAAVSANGTGNVLLQAIGATGSPAATADVLVTAAVSSAAGDISVIGYRGVNLAGTGSVTVTGAGGTDDIWAQNGSITEAAGFDVATDGANIGFLAAINSVLLGEIDARLTADRTGSTLSSQSAWGSVSVVATTGYIVNSQAASVTTTEIYANALGLVSADGIGALGTGVFNPIETEVATVAAATTAIAGIAIQDASAIAVGSVGSVPVNRVSATAATAATVTTPIAGIATTTNGAVVLAAGGTITLSQGVAANGSGNVLVQASGSTSNVVGNAVVMSTSGSVTVTAGQSVIFGFGDNIHTTGSIDIEAAAGAATFDAGQPGQQRQQQRPDPRRGRA